MAIRAYVAELVILTTDDENEKQKEKDGRESKKQKTAHNKNGEAGSGLFKSAGGYG